MSPYRLAAYQFSTRATILCLAAGGAVLGVAMILGGPDRFGAPGFATARLVQGGVYTWGAVLMTSSGVSLAGIVRGWSRRVVMAGMALEGCWFAFFAVALGLAAFRDPKVAVTGPIIYTVIAIVCAVGFDTGRELRR